MATCNMTAQRTLGHIITAKLTFFQDLPVKVRGAHYTNVRIIFTFLWYFKLELHTNHS